MRHLAKESSPRTHPLGNGCMYPRKDSVERHSSDSAAPGMPPKRAVHRRVPGAAPLEGYNRREQCRDASLRHQWHASERTVPRSSGSRAYHRQRAQSRAASLRRSGASPRRRRHKSLDGGSGASPAGAVARRVPGAAAACSRARAVVRRSISKNAPWRHIPRGSSRETPPLRQRRYRRREQSRDASPRTQQRLLELEQS